MNIPLIIFCIWLFIKLLSRILMHGKNITVDGVAGVCILFMEIAILGWAGVFKLF